MRILDRLRPKRKRVHRLANLSPEILHLIIECLSREGLEDILNVCLVSRRFYLFAVFYLYRYITLDLSRASHIRLLQRLSAPECRLAERIRAITIINTATQDIQEWDKLYVMFKRITCLWLFTWIGPLRLPYFLLDQLASRHPKARLHVSTWKPMTLFRSEFAHITRYVMSHSAGLQLNKLVYRYDGAQRLDPDFKKNLLMALRDKVTLSILTIANCNSYEVNTFPEMLDYFRNSSFRHIEKLILHTTMFTCRELLIWASRGDWRRLTLLHLQHASKIRYFIDRTPCLEHLSFHFDHRIDTDNTETELVTTLTSNPLPELRCMSYSIYGQHLVPPPPIRCAPWDVLPIYPGITELYLTREWDCQRGVTSLFAPDASDIHRIRTLCPNLIRLSINIDIPRARSRFRLIIEELSLFKEPIDLVLHLRLPLKHSKSYRNFCLTCKRLFLIVVLRRKLLKLPCERPFQICFQAMRMDKESPGIWVRSECTVWLNSSGWLASSGYNIDKRENLDRMSVIDLEELSEEQSRLERYRDSKGYRQELRRRERSLDTTFGFSEDFTLHNIWAGDGELETNSG